MRTILAATDFSKVATNAVHYAAAMAEELQAELILFNAYSIPATYSDGILMAPVEELKGASEDHLEKLKKEVLTITKGKITVHTRARMGNIVEEMRDYCQSNPPFAIVIGTRGKTNSEIAIFGTSTLSIIRHFTVPVVCVPPTVEYRKGVKQVGLACDFRDVTGTVPAELIRSFVAAFNDELHILNIDYKEKGFRSSSPADTFAFHHLFEKQSPQYHFIEHPDVARGLGEFVMDHHLDMLITIPKHHDFFERLFRPSTTKRLVKLLPAALVCVHE